MSTDLPTTDFPSSGSAAPAVPKWPFVIGDLLLVASALGVWAVYAPLSPLQAILCLGAVGLGAVLFVIPFAMEYATRVQFLRLELDQARTEDFQRLGALEAETRKQARLAAESQEHLSRAAASLENAARRCDTHLAPLAEIHKNLEAAAAECQEAAAPRADQEKEELETELGRLRQGQAGDLRAAAESLAAVAGRLEELAARLASAPAPGNAAATLAHIQQRLELLSHLVNNLRPADAGASPPPVAADDSSATTEASPAPPRESSSIASGSLLAKALATAQSAEDSPAVSRLIQSRPRRARKPKPAPRSPPADSPATPDPTIPAEPAGVAENTVTPPAPAEAEAWDAFAASHPGTHTTSGETSPDNSSEAATTVLPNDSAAALTAPVVETDTPAPPPEPVPERTVTAKARAKAAALRDDDDETPPAAQPELAVAEVETPTRRRAPKAPVAGAATLVARVLIGIGNKPFVRGDGPGLSPDRGVPMEFVEIGKWQWSAPPGATSPITLRILKNDEIPAAGEPILLPPGETIDISPVFPA